jgi:hypothetical protein
MNLNEFRDASYLFVAADVVDNGAVEINCSDLVGSSGFGYANGDKITFRVAATNSFGDSEWAYPSVDVQKATTFSMLLL